MKIRFSKSDVFDTKGEQEYINEVAGQVNEVAEAPIYTAELTEEEVGYIKSFVELCNAVIEEDKAGIHPNGVEFGAETVNGAFSAITITTVVVDSNDEL